MEYRPLEAGRYTVTYAFDDGNGGRARVVGRIREAVSELQREGRELVFLGATRALDDAEQLRTVTVRFEARTQGVLGLLNCRALLPACGAPRRVDTEASDSEGPHVAIASGTRG